MPKKVSKPKPQQRRKKLVFRQSDVMRAIRAARAENLPIGTVEVDPHTGRISITPGAPVASTEWDKV